MAELDTEELLHLGAYALRNGDLHGALVHLKNCLELDPDLAKAAYLLGAAYAQLGLYEHARQWLEQAILIDGEEYTAVFQLGLLHLTGGDPEAAASVWTALEPLGDGHYLCLFKSALLALANNDFAACIAHIDQGVAANTGNEALNRDMLRIRAEAHAALEPDAHTDSASASNVSRYLLSGYQQLQGKT